MAGRGGVTVTASAAKATGGRSSGRLLHVLDADMKVEPRSSNGSSPGSDGGGGDTRDLSSERTPESSLVLSALPLLSE